MTGDGGHAGRHHVNDRGKTMHANRFRIIATALLTIAPIAALAPAAQAGGATGDRFEKDASISWVERGATSALFGGNAHRGVVSASDDQSTPQLDQIDGLIEDWTCPAGAPVPELFIHEDPDAPATRCTYLGTRELAFSGAVVSFSPRLASAHVTGTAVGTDPTGTRSAVRLPVDLTLRAQGTAVRTAFTDRYVDADGTRVTHRYVEVNREAAATGTVGTTRLGDEASDVVVAQIASEQDVFTRR